MPPCRPAAIPMLAVTWVWMSPIRNGWPIESVTRWAICSAFARSAWSSTRIANSSPPRRAVRSASRVHRLSRARDLHQHRVPHLVAVRVVHELEVVEVHEHHHRPPAASGRGQPGIDVLAEQAPVGELGQPVVECLVLQLVLQHGQLGQRALQLPVLQGGPGVAGDGRVQPQILRGEGGHVSEPVGHHHGADEPLVRPERRDHGVADLAVLTELERGGVQQERLPVLGQVGVEGLPQGGIARSHDRRPLVRHRGHEVRL